MFYKKENTKSYKKYGSFIKSVVNTFDFERTNFYGILEENNLQAPKEHRKKSQYTILLCSPHPDDEALVGAFALRAKNEEGARVVNCAITLGSEISQKKLRFKEVQSSCDILGFELELPCCPEELGFSDISLNSKKTNLAQWNVKKQQLLNIFEKIKPDCLVIPHSKDWHKTHKGTNELAIDSAKAYSNVNPEKNILLVETEYWQQMENPNLMIGVSPTTETILVTAIAEHKGEIKRNSYHLKHPARMIDNVRRGSEIILGQGSKSCNFLFAELYRISLITPKKIMRLNKAKYVIPPDVSFNLSELLEFFKFVS